ncbi:MAG: hypothetical protein IIW58_03375 [Bacteroidales bacterium]|nr:hypothetical protein [Bacteroidales bacterium]
MMHFPLFAFRIFIVPSFVGASILVPSGLYDADINSVSFSSNVFRIPALSTSNMFIVLPLNNAIFLVPSGLYEIEYKVLCPTV